MAALFAAVALSTAPVFAQDVTTAPPPPPTISAPPPTISAPPPPVAAAPAPAPAPAPTPVAAAPVQRAAPAPQARAQPRAARVAPRAPAIVRAPAPVAAAPGPAPVPEAAPVETAPPPPVAVEPAPPPAPIETAAPADTRTTTSYLPWILGAAALLILAFAFLALRRRRPTEEYREAVYEEPVLATAPAAAYEEPAPAMAPVAAAPAFVRAEPVALDEDETYEPIPAASIEEVELVDSNAADMEALAAASEPVAGRPWLEFLLRPLRAGTSRDNAIVEFELTVGNTGSVSARDVRISTWVVAAGQGTAMERSLIEPPAEATRNEVDIDAGDGTRVEARIAMSKDGHDAPILPVVVADASYTLPDGSEGRTQASFAIGVPEEDGSALQPFRIDGSSGLRENVEARLYGALERA